MATYKLKLPSSGEADGQTRHPKEVFGQPVIEQLREAVEQAVYGNVEADKSNDPQREQTVSTLTALGQMGELTEMDIDEAKKGYL